MSTKPTGTSEAVRVAFIGAGGWALARHLPSLVQMNDVRLVAVCDISRDRSQAAADQFEIPEVYTDYRRMLDETPVDAVYAIMPPHHVFDVAVEVLGRKHHLFIEKPPGVTAFQCRQMARHAERNGVLAMAGFQRRYVPLVNQLKDRIESHGPIHTAQVNYIKHQPDPLAYYQGAIDILSCDAVHAVDTLRHLCGGDVADVRSSVRAVDSKAGPTAFHALVTFSNGVVGVLNANWACGHRVFSVEMHTTGMSAYAKPDIGGTLFTEDSAEPEAFDPAVCAGSEDENHRLGFFAENRHFIDCVRSGKQPRTSLREATGSMELVERIYQGAMD
ncbi:MAG: Gfo/Idh/MocA family oxidoreductase [bacterium]|nr:Gfo/Idh/MocA family oxidoreductase [bacterium]